MAATPRAMLAGMNASPKLQRAGRAFLLRLVYENGAEEAARVLRDLADELEGLATIGPETSCPSAAIRDPSVTHRGRKTLAN